MKQQIIQIGQHLPAKMQVAETPVKKVEMSLNVSYESQYTAQDLLGLSWVLFEETD